MMKVRGRVARVGLPLRHPSPVHMICARARARPLSLFRRTHQLVFAPSSLRDSSIVSASWGLCIWSSRWKGLSASPPHPSLPSLIFYHATCACGLGLWHVALHRLRQLHFAVSEFCILSSCVGLQTTSTTPLSSWFTRSWMFADRVNHHALPSPPHTTARCDIPEHHAASYTLALFSSASHRTVR